MHRSLARLCGAQLRRQNVRGGCIYRGHVSHGWGPASSDAWWNTLDSVSGNPRRFSSFRGGQSARFDANNEDEGSISLKDQLSSQEANSEQFEAQQEHETPQQEKLTTARVRRRTIDDVKSIGMDQLVDSVKLVASKSRKSLVYHASSPQKLQPEHIQNQYISNQPTLGERQKLLIQTDSTTLNRRRRQRRQPPTPMQLRAASRLHTVIDQIMERYIGGSGSAMSAIFTQMCLPHPRDARVLTPLEITFVEVSPDCRHARVYWTLPYSFAPMPLKHVQKLTALAKDNLKDGGPLQKQMQVLVAARISGGRGGKKYAPLIRFIAENTELTHSHAAYNAINGPARLSPQQNNSHGDHISYQYQLDD